MLVPDEKLDCFDPSVNINNYKKAPNGHLELLTPHTSKIIRARARSTVPHKSVLNFALLTWTANYKSEKFYGYKPELPDLDSDPASGTPIGVRVAEALLAHRVPVLARPDLACNMARPILKQCKSARSLTLYYLLTT